MEIDCEFGYAGNNEYTCFARNVELTEPRKQIKAFKGDTKNMIAAYVQNLQFSDGPKLQYIPRDLQKHFPSMVVLHFNGCGIKEISKRDLIGLENLRRLEMISCQLTSLPDDLFNDMKSLQLVSFNKNQIESASSNLLKPLVGRRDVSVDLRGNKNIDAVFNPRYIEKSTHKSLEEIMKEIDEKCSKPIKAKVIEPEDFNEDVKKLWSSGQFSDFKVISGDKKFDVHRNILGIRSSVLADFFKNHKQAAEVKINDFSHRAVESLLRFIYTNEILHEDNAIENFVIAQKFKIPKMKATYEEIIFSNVNDNNAYETFLFAHQNAAEDLKKEAFDIISKKFPDPLPESLMKDPTKLKQLIDNRLEYESLLGAQQKMSL